MSNIGAMAGTGPTHTQSVERSNGNHWRTCHRHRLNTQCGRLTRKHRKRSAAQPTHGGTPVAQGIARRLIARRSRWFISRNLRWTSQSIAFAHTRSDAHGGQAWNAMVDLNDKVGRCLALWSNSVFGAIVRNAYGQTSQAGRARIQVNAVAGLPCPDFGADSVAGTNARRVGGLNFAELSELVLEPFAYMFSRRKPAQN